jgi:NAD-dependent dihydropyrimidine dehydrogenase PreA subunit
MPYQVAVNSRTCSGCEECLEVCTAEVFKMEGGKSVPVKTEECLGCENCVEVCKEKAITVRNLEQELSETARLLLEDIL